MPHITHRLAQLAALVLGIAHLSACLYAGTWGSGSERTQAELMEPTALETGPVAVGDVDARVMTVRVYVSESYQSNTLRWKEKFDQQVARANDALIHPFQIRLRVAEVRTWDPRDTSSSMEAMLDRLEAQDPGEDVDWVVGLVGSLPGFSSSFHELGVARVMGRHLLLRGMNDLSEYEHVASSDAYSDLSEDERKALYKRRKIHKESVVLLHELGHTLGAIHTHAPSWIMSGTYDAEQHAFAPANVDLIRAALSFRSRGAPDPYSAAALGELKEQIDRDRWSGWVRQDRDDMIALLSGSPAPARHGSDANARLNDAIQRALAQSARGEHRVALQIIIPWIASHPDQHVLRALACQFASRAEDVPSQEGMALCKEALTYQPGDPAVIQSFARIQLNQGDPERAVEFLRRGQPTIAALPHRDRERRAYLWRVQAGLYQRARAITWAEEIAHHHDAPAALLTWVAEARAIYGLPPRADRLGVPPEREAAYVAWLEAMSARDDEPTRRSLQARLDRLAEDPRAKLPGALALRCELLWMLGRLAPARAACEDALRLHEPTLRAHAVLARLDERAGDPASAIRHQRRAIDLYPDDRATWTNHAALLKRLRKREALVALQDKYADHFGEPMPE